MIDTFADAVTVSSFDGEAAASFGRVASALARRGTRIGDLDAMIAGHALALGITLVTNNTKHFGRVGGLRIVNWA